MCKKIKQLNNTKMPDLATLYNYGKTRVFETNKSSYVAILMLSDVKVFK